MMEIFSFIHPKPIILYPTRAKDRQMRYLKFGMFALHTPGGSEKTINIKYKIYQLYALLQSIAILK